MNANDKAAAKARVRAKLDARQQMSAREYLLSLLHATHTHEAAEQILDRFERESPTAGRLGAVMDLCDEMERKGIASGEPFTVRRVHRLALGDDRAAPSGFNR